MERRGRSVSFALEGLIFSTFPFFLAGSTEVRRAKVAFVLLDDDVAFGATEVVEVDQLTRFAGSTTQPLQPAATLGTGTEFG